MQAGVITFPGSNCDRDLRVALESVLGRKVARLWHGETELPPLDLIGIPGGFSYGDYLRCGAISARSPIMAEVARRARQGVLVLGVCNGFQVLTESGLLPGALIRNAQLTFVCRWVRLRVTTDRSPFTAGFARDQEIRLPVAHHDGNYVAGDDVLDRLEDEDRIALRYLDNPNGSMRDIAAVLSETRNVMGIMPHPERAADPLHGGTDGRTLLASMLERVG
jgi:phosphoribosylformylglycinamidine synthase subunit PurQ / glutaminase